MTVDSASGTAGCHQIECAEPSPSECVNTASVYTPSSPAEGSIFRKKGGNIEDLASITCWCVRSGPSNRPRDERRRPDEMGVVQGSESQHTCRGLGALGRQALNSIPWLTCLLESALTPAVVAGRSYKCRQRRSLREQGIRRLVTTDFILKRTLASSDPGNLRAALQNIPVPAPIVSFFSLCILDSCEPSIEPC